MKTKILFALSVIILIGGSCKKSFTDPKNPSNGIDITKAVNSGALFSTWYMNDEDVSKQKDTQSSTVFRNKVRPQLSFDKGGTYALNYMDSLTGKPISEAGTWSTNTSDNTLILKGSNTYTFSILSLTEETLVFMHVIPVTKTTTTSEGVASSQTTMGSEMLYMEDND
jgi:hypothetical protein